MRLLLDTHTFLWFAAGDPSLSASARRRIEDVRNDKFLSLASVWEMAIKVSLGRLALDLPLVEAVEQGAVENGISLLPIQLPHVVAVASLPLHHRDPFDRLLIAQAQAEGLAIVGRDEAFDDYKVRRIW